MKVGIYAHFSLSDTIKADIWDYLEELILINFGLVFVSNSPICQQDAERLEAMCLKVIKCENVGLDFCMWKAGIASVCMPEITELLITNSSIIGPLRPLAWVFNKAAGWNCDFWGLTDNAEIAPHLQSYFIVFRKCVIDSWEFRDFWNGVLPYRSKQQIIMSYEVGLTVWLGERGFFWRAMFEQKEIYRIRLSDRTFFEGICDKILGQPITMGNVTLLFPELLLELGFPFIKASLLNHGSNMVSPEDARAIIDRFSLSKNAL